MLLMILHGGQETGCSGFHQEVLWLSIPTASKLNNLYF